MKITIDNRDLPYSIDTYGMFTGDSVDESESEHYRETYGLTDDEWQSLGFDYDHAGIVKDLATESISNLENAVVGQVVKSITLKDTKSPQFYNFTTDSYTAEWDIDETQLKKYILSRHNRFTKWVLDPENGYDQDKRNSDPEYATLAMLEFYLLDQYTEDDYNSEMWERESEIYFNNMNLDAESQKLIDSKEPIEQ